MHLSVCFWTQRHSNIAAFFVQCIAVSKQSQYRHTKDSLEVARSSVASDTEFSMGYLLNCLHKKLGKGFDLFQALWSDMLRVTKLGENWLGCGHQSTYFVMLLNSEDGFIFAKSDGSF